MQIGDRKGYQVLFGNELAQFYTPDGKLFLTGVGSGNLICMEVPLQAMIIKSCLLNKPVNLNGRHYRFGHTRVWKKSVEWSKHQKG